MKWKSNEQYKNLIRETETHSCRINFRSTREDTLHFTLALSTPTVMYGLCGGVCHFAYGVLPHGGTPRRISTSIEKRVEQHPQPSPFLVLLPLQGPLTFFRSFPFHRLLFIRISSFKARSGLFGGYRRKGEKKEIRVHGRVIKNEGNEGFPWQLFPLFSEYDSPPRPDCGVGLEREIERENHFIS